MKIPKIGYRSKVILVLIVIITPLLVYHVIEVIRAQKIISYHSDMLSLQGSTITELQEYYSKNGSYPENLQRIRDSILDRWFVSPVPEEHKDGHLLNEFKYSTDGSSYTMILEIRGYTYVRKGQKGETVEYEFYINGKLSQKFTKKYEQKAEK